jgi:hypothetical protein
MHAGGFSPLPVRVVVACTASVLEVCHKRPHKYRTVAACHCDGLQANQATSCCTLVQIVRLLECLLSLPCTALLGSQPSCRSAVLTRELDVSFAWLFCCLMFCLSTVCFTVTNLVVTVRPLQDNPIMCCWCIFVTCFSLPGCPAVCMHSVASLRACRPCRTASCASLIDACCLFQV